MNYKIRKAIITDLRQIIDLEQRCFTSPWGENALLSELQNDNSFYVVVVDGIKIIAFAGYQDILSQGHITTMAVDASYRGMGLGELLLLYLLKNMFENEIEDVTLEVRVSNEPAIKLYEKYGFKIYGTRKNYYSDDHEDAYIMWRFKDGKNKVL